MASSTNQKAPARQPRINPETKIPLIVADWRTGEYTIRELAHRHSVSKSFVANHTKSIPKDAAVVVDNLIKAKQGLALLDGQTVDSVHEVVDKRIQYSEYFDKRAVENVEAAFILPVENQNDCKARAETISKARENVLGKAPDTALQINNTIAFTKIERVIVR